MKRSIKSERARLSAEANRTARAQVYRAFQRAGVRGLTDDELDMVTPKHLRQNSTRARRVDLVNDGLLKPTAMKRRTRAKKMATVWVVKR